MPVPVLQLVSPLEQGNGALHPFALMPSLCLFCLCAGDVMILKSDGTLKHVKDFTAQIQTLDIPGEVKAGYSPIGFVRCGRAACRITGINWKVGWREGGLVGVAASPVVAVHRITPPAALPCMLLPALANDEVSTQGFLSKHSQCPL